MFFTFRAYSRMALAYHKLNDLQNARVYYLKSLAEHRTPETKAKLSEVTNFICMFQVEQFEIDFQFLSK